MEFEWDEAKSRRCLRERGFSFAFVIPAFADPKRAVEMDERWPYGEVRYRLHGRIGRAVRIISARKANARERRRHGDEGKPQG